MLLLCLTSSEESKLCLQLSLPTVVLSSSSVSQILWLKTKSFKKSTSLLANICVLSLFKCKSSLHKTSLVMSLLMNWKLFLLYSSRYKSLTCLINYCKFELRFNEDGQYYHFFGAVRQTFFSNIFNTVHDIFDIYLVNCIICNIIGSCLNDHNIWSIFYQGWSNEMI